MVDAKAGSHRGNNKDNGSSKDHDDDDDDDFDDDSTVEGPPPKFVLSGDDTGSGIDYHILDEESWQELEKYCKKWGVKQGHLERIYSRFARTIARTEHLDFTVKPLFHASLDFLADEFMTTAGEFAAQIFIQTWFLRRKRGLKRPKDRRCVDFARLVVMCCDLARLGDYELLANLWVCVLHRFSNILPKGTVNLDTRLNTDLVKEVITVLHPSLDKELRLLISMLIAGSEQLPDSQRRQEGKGNGGCVSGTADAESGGWQQEHQEPRDSPGGAQRYLTLRTILRFSFQHPPLLFPVVHFQRVLRSKIIGSRYWIRRRKPAQERGIDFGSSLGLPSVYHDLFDRIESYKKAWIIASGHILLHALDTPHYAAVAHSSTMCGKIDASGGLKGGNVENDTEDIEDIGGSSGDWYDKRCGRLLDNCLPPQWYKLDGVEHPVYSGLTGEVRDKLFPAVTIALAKLKSSAKKALSPKSSVASPVGTTARTRKVETGMDDTPATICATSGAPPPQQPHELSQSHVNQNKPPSPQETREVLRPPSEGKGKHRCHPGEESHHIVTPTATTATTAATTPSATTPASDINTCAICLRRTSPVVMCRKCGKRSAKALKDIRGSRQARIILVPYGAWFGVRELDALQAEGDAVKRWVRLSDDETGGHFYYNVYYDSSVWESAIELPQPSPQVKRARRRKGGGGGGMLSVGSPKSGSADQKSAPPPRSPPGSPPGLTSIEEAGSPAPPSRGNTFRAAAWTPAALSSSATSASTAGRTALTKTKTALSAASMAARKAAGGSVRASRQVGSDDASIDAANPDRQAVQPPRAKTPSTTPMSPKTTAAAAASSPASACPSGRRAATAEGGDAATTAPEIVLDAHRRIYPSFRFITLDEAEGAATAAAKGGVAPKDVGPAHGSGVSPSRGL